MVRGPVLSPPPVPAPARERDRESTMLLSQKTGRLEL